MFHLIKKQVTDRFNQFQTAGPLFILDYDKDTLWRKYIEGFEESERQEHMCNSCKNFIRAAGGVVSISPDFTIRFLWEIEDAPAEFQSSLSLMLHYLSLCPIAGKFYSEFPTVGVDRNRDGKRPGVFWEHFHARVPAELVRDGAAPNGELRNLVQVFQRGLKELTPESLDIALDLIAQDTLYKGPEYKDALVRFKGFQTTYKALVGDRTREAFVWRVAAVTPPNVTGLRNHLIGQLLQDLSEGQDLERAQSAYERMAAPENWKRPKAAVTPAMLEAAKKKFEKLGLLSALKRRRLDSRDLTVAKAFYVYRPQSKPQDVFAELAGAAPVNVQTLERCEEIGIEKFIADVLPTAKCVKVLLESRLFPNLVTLTGPCDPEAGNLFAWESNYGWSYAGGFGDAIRERVKAAGGNVDGWMRISLAWHNHDDLDLHLADQGYHHVFYGDKHDHLLQATLDVDMNQ